jgi:NADH-quinone oxidoreductase subunit C
VSYSKPTFSPVVAGSALGSQAPQPSTPKNVPHRGGEANPSAVAIAQRFAGGVKRVDVVWGETTVYVDGDQAHDIIEWLHDDPTQRYDYLSDVTAVEFRDLEHPI